MKTYSKIALTALLLLLIYILRPLGPERTVEILSGMSAGKIANKLYETGIIRNRRMFQIVLRFSGRARVLKSGIYSIKPGSSYFYIISRLVRVSDMLVKVTIPEGFTTEQIAQRLYEKEIIGDADEFIKIVLEKDLRGFLFPETYIFQDMKILKK
ncbi:MAG: endolytic transglycosylase MltG [Elusimicrobiota bacterium]